MRDEPVPVRTASADQREAAEQQAAEAARVELAAQLEEAYQRGVTDTRAALEEAVRAELATHLRTVESAAAAFVTARRELATQAETAIRELAVEIAAHVMRCEVEGGRSIAAGLAQEAVKRLENLQELEVVVNPLDEELLRDQQAAIGARVPGVAIRVLASEAVERGGCRVQGGGMVVDAELRSGLDIVAEELGVELAAARQRVDEATSALARPDEPAAERRDESVAERPAA
jgi:flagellar assembly protein FliH